MLSVAERKLEDKAVGTFSSEISQHMLNIVYVWRIGRAHNSLHTMRNLTQYSGLMDILIVKIPLYI